MEVAEDLGLAVMRRAIRLTTRDPEHLAELAAHRPVAVVARRLVQLARVEVFTVELQPEARLPRSLTLAASLLPEFDHEMANIAWSPLEGGWLADRNFHDFAGSTLVHSVGGWGALAGVMLLGPRLGKYVNGGGSKPIMGHES